MNNTSGYAGIQVGMVIRLTGKVVQRAVKRISQPAAPLQKKITMKAAHIAVS